MNFYKLIILVKNNKNYLKNFILVFKKFIFLNCFLLVYENWGLINLSYKIKNESKCFYLYFFLKTSGYILKVFDKYFKYNKNIIRYIFIKNKKNCNNNISYFLKKKIKKNLKKNDQF